MCAGGAHPTSRALAGSSNALQQQNLTPAQQAAQAAITAPATQRDGKVPVRTGLAWAALGEPLSGQRPLNIDRTLNYKL